MGVKDEIKSMFNALAGRGEKEDVKTDPPSTDPPAPETDPPTMETDQPATDEPKTEPPTTDEPVEDGIEVIRRENEELRKKIDEMSGPKTEPPKTEPPSTLAPIEDQDFLGDLDPEDVSRDPAEFNKMMNSIYKKAVTDVREEMQQNSAKLMQGVPEAVASNVSIQEGLRAMRDNFYEKNTDLKPFSKVVATVFEEVAQKNSDKPYDEILELVGVETRDRLELGKAPPVKSNDDPPPLPRKKGGRVKTQPQRPDKLSSEIGDMNESLHR